MDVTTIKARAPSLASRPLALLTFFLQPGLAHSPVALLSDCLGALALITPAESVVDDRQGGPRVGGGYPVTCL